MGYLGLRITALDDGLKLDMNTYTQKMMENFAVVGTSPTPACEDLFNEVDTLVLTYADSKKFHTCVAKLLFLVKRTRPDILFCHIQYVYVFCLCGFVDCHSFMIFTIQLLFFISSLFI